VRNRIGTTKSFDGTTAAAPPNRQKTESASSMARQAANKEFKEESMSLDNSHRPAKEITEKDDEK